jgi:hypothetical protein
MVYRHFQFPQVHNLGPRNIVCQHCHAFYWKIKRYQDGVFTECSLNGAFFLFAIKEAPLYLQHLFTGNSGEALQFQKNLRAFNCAFAFTSVDCNIDWQLKKQRQHTAICYP